MEIIPVQKVNAVDHVYGQMKKLLIDGSWAPGTRIPSEASLCELFGVSRITIRQALQKLKALDLIETRNGSGSYVRSVDVAGQFNDLIPVMFLGDISHRQVFEYREMIDAESVRLATPQATDADFAQLEKHLSRMQRAAARQDNSAFSRSDLDFHMYICEMTHNPLIVKSNRILREVLELSMTRVVEKMSYSNGLSYHRRILDAMKARDSAGAEALMREHIRANDAYF